MRRTTLGHDSRVQSDSLRRRLRRLSRAELQEEARAFVLQFHREQGIERHAPARLREVRQELRGTGTWTQTSEEVAFGARVAWRNHARCIGRLHWRSLEVLDRRDVETSAQVGEAVFEHIRLAQGEGRITPMITIFPPARPDSLPPYIESRQAIQYAGYLQPDGGFLGDPITVEATRQAETLGWRAPGGRSAFDLLPLLVREPTGARKALPLPDGLVMEVGLSHVDHPAIEELELRWYALPLVSSMILTIGGVDYPCAPFNGWYMGTEIASRNLADERRYDLLPKVAEALGLRRDAGLLWRDRALTVLNEAVLQSFQQAGASIVDHHTASEQFLDFHHQERARGRAVSGDWSWIVPPQASAACPVFHLEMEHRTEVPNFYVSSAADGAHLRVWHDQEEHGRWWGRWEWLRERWRARQRRRG